jgi:NAD(P)H-dependent flavin oxidoreductase YrpB (nitropropane dioxygenase family)
LYDPIVLLPTEDQADNPILFQLTSLTQPTPDDLRKEIKKCRDLTKKPFGVNLTVLPTISPPPYGEYAQVIIDEGIKIVETAGLVKDYVAKFKAAGCIVLHKCTTIRHSLSAIKMGVDFLSIDGFECGGHVGEHDIPNFVLLNRAREQLRKPNGELVPYIASGGMANGNSLAAALSLGACGINMGTRFMCTVEAPIHNNIKEAIVNASEDDTDLLMRRWTNTARFFRNSVTKAAAKIEQESTTGKFEEIAEYVSGKRGRQVFLNGDPDYGVSPCLRMRRRAMLTIDSNRFGQQASALASSMISQPAKCSYSA